MSLSTHRHAALECILKMIFEKFRVRHKSVTVTREEEKVQWQYKDVAAGRKYVWGATWPIKSIVNARSHKIPSVIVRVEIDSFQTFVFFFLWNTHNDEKISKGSKEKFFFFYGITL